VVYEDSKADPKTGVAAAHKLIDINHVQALIDDAASSVALAVVPIATQARLPMLSTGSTNPRLSGSSPFFLRLWNSDAEEAAVSAKFIASTLGLKRGAVLYIQNEYGEGLKDAFSAAFSKLGGSVVGAVPFPQDAADFKNEVTKTYGMKPDFVYLVAYPNNFATILPQVNRARGEHPVIGTAALNDPEVLKQAGSQANNVYFPYARPPRDTAVRRAFLSAYKKAYNQSPGSPAAEGYDAAKLLVEAISAAAPDGSKVVEYLRSRSFDGASGTIRFDANGDVHKPMGMYVVADGKAKVVPATQ